MTEKDQELFNEAPQLQENFEIKQDDFVLVQSDAKIHDKKLETKPTTFFKDALKRFAKNKSSVVGAIIIGILILLAIIVPMVSTKNVDRVSKPEAFLEPKLFNAGFGFWDGTRKHKRIVYDVDNATPANYKKNAVRDLVVDSAPTLIDQASKYGHYGSIMFENENTSSLNTVYLYTKIADFDPAMNYVYTITFSDEDNVNNKQLGEYQISIAIAKETEAMANGLAIKWRRVGQTEWFDLEKPLIEVRVGQYIEWAYLGDKSWHQTNVLVQDIVDDETGEVTTPGILADKDADVTVIASYDPEANIITYHFSDDEYEEFIVKESDDEEADDFHPNLHNGEIIVSVDRDKEMIKWRFDDEGSSSNRDYESFASLNDGTDSRFIDYVLKPFGTETSIDPINITEKLAALGVTDTVEGRLCFTLKAKDVRQYILIKSIALSATPDEGVEDSDAKLAEMQKLTAFSDATQLVIRDNKAEDYWYCTGRKGVRKSELYYCDFVYDTYLAVYDTYDAIIGKTTFNDYVKAGWMTYEYDRNTNTLTYEILSDECPIESIDTSTVKKLGAAGATFEATCKVRTYAKMGYKSMPRFLFGTNASGNDMFKKAFSGLRTSLILGVCTAAFCFIFGLIWGSISGYFGGNVDLFMERFCDILSGVPWIVIMTLCILHLGNNFVTFFLALCMTGWMGTAGRTRTQFYRFKGREYVLASRTLGSSDMRLIFRHILPNSLGTIITGSVLMIPSVIFSEATLAYLNLGLQGVQSFGVMMAENQKYLEKVPHLVVFPAVVIALMMISFNLFGNGLRDALNPSLKGSD